MTVSIVGSGPNGLAAGAYLAQLGASVRVIEANKRIGGGARSAELTLPGLIHDECSGFHPLGLQTEFTQAVDLGAHGLTYLWPEVQYSHPLDGGTGGAALRSVARTAERLHDRRWHSAFGSVSASFGAVSDDFLGPVISIPGHPLALANFGLRAALPVTTIARLFKTEAAKALWAGVAAHAFRPFASPFSSAVGVALASAAHTYGWPVARGGTQSITDAMASVIQTGGGKIETNRRVESIGELGSPDVVLLDTAPAAAASICGDRMPARIARAYRSYEHGPGAFKVDFAVEEGIPWLHEESLTAGTVHVGGTYGEIADAEAMVCQGEMPERPFVLVGQQYIADPSRSNGDVHPVYSYAHVPSGWAGDATEAIIAQIERFAPGFRDRVLATHVRSATDMSRYNANYVGGDIITGANTMSQLVFRPRRTTQPYDTGIEGVYLCSAATPPGAGAHGMCGYQAARRALTKLKLL
ncbi:MAG: NAD(P)/FAD-dependent oxidoreductase [Acidimicrobiales bacterium]|nr:NAD(P)/FAD-dependent oxidoreductase [Acidimicrobiales bacterium]